MATYEFIEKREAANLLKCHPGSLPRYRKDEKIGWIEGVHYTRPNGQKVLYNKELLHDWLVNRHDPAAHLVAIENYQASLLSNQRRKRKAG